MNNFRSGLEQARVAKGMDREFPDTTVVQKDPEAYTIFLDSIKQYMNLYLTQSYNSQNHRDFTEQYGMLLMGIAELGLDFGIDADIAVREALGRTIGDKT